MDVPRDRPAISRFQLFILAMTLAVIGLMCIFPPWQYTYQQSGISQVKRPAPYAFVLKPPAPEDPSLRRCGVVIDSRRLVFQCVAAAGVGFGAVLLISVMRPLLRKKRR